MPRGEASRLQTAVIDSAGGYRTKTRSPALAIYGRDTPGIDVQAEILKRRMRYLIRYMEREESIRRRVERILRGIAEYDVEHPKGPVALIIKDLRRHGAKLTEELVLVEPGEMDLAIMVEPEEVLMRRIHQMSQRAYLKENAKTRAILVGVREIELCREIGTYTGLEEPDKKVMRLVNAGGLWTGKHGEKAGYLDSPKCKLCGVETPDNGGRIQTHVLEV